MTLIIGIVCQDGIVIAGDSQTTSESSGTKNKYAEKIHLVRFENGSALVAESGVAQVSQTVIDALSLKAHTINIATDETVPKLVEAAMHEMRQRHLSAYPPQARTLEEIQGFFQSNYCELMFAFRQGSRSYLYTADTAWCIPVKVSKRFDAIGCGAPLATYLLNQLCLPDMSTEFACAVAVHVVETVKEYDLYCDGPTRLGVIKLPQDLHSPFSEVSTEGLTAIFEEQQVKQLVRIAAEIDSQTKEERSRLIRDQLHKQTKAYINDLFNKHGAYEK